MFFWPKSYNWVPHDCVEAMRVFPIQMTILGYTPPKKCAKPKFRFVGTMALFYPHHISIVVGAIPLFIHNPWLSYYTYIHYIHYIHTYIHIYIIYTCIYIYIHTYIYIHDSYIYIHTHTHILCRDYNHNYTYHLTYSI